MRTLVLMAKKNKYVVIAGLAFIVALLLSYTVCSSRFLVIKPISHIEIIDTATKNKESGGTDLRIRGIKIDGEDIAFNQLTLSPGWQFFDGLMVAVNPGSPVTAEFDAENAKFLEVELQRHDGSGILHIKADGRKIAEEDLYASTFENITVKKKIAKVSIFSNLLFFILLYGISFLVLFAWDWLKAKGREDERFRLCIKTLLMIGLMVGSAAATWFQMELSSNYENISMIFEMEVKYILLNILTNLVMIFALIVLTNRVWRACLLFSIASFLISIVNHYTIKFHGTPLSVLEIKNARTALNVLHSYSIKLDSEAVGIILIFLACIGICVALRKLEKGKGKIPYRIVVLRDVCMICLGIAIAFFGYLSPNSVKPKKTIGGGGSWDETYHVYGYMSSSLELIYRSRHAIDMPKGYAEEKVENMRINGNPAKSEINPDIILILNETYFDLRQIADIQTDVPFLENIDAMEGIVKGYAVAPSVGGMTNSSEYELLTSNSLQLMKGITPFGILDMKGANSIVSHLNQLGYQSVGAHSESSQNYARGRAYPDMGFSQVHFESDFKVREYYGDRIYFETDESLYKSLISWYEETGGDDAPRFDYLLTIQNHGGWDINPPEDDIVHVLNGYNDYEQEINEFLSCIKLTDDAFKQLTDYFSNVERPVVICMVGDHSPAFASSIIDGKYSVQEQRLRLRGTPFLIWSNFGLEDRDVGYVSMNYISPLLLSTAGVRTSPYYDYMLDLMGRVPILTSYDVYIDKEGVERAYDHPSEYEKDVSDYFYLEYNNLQKTCKQSLFAPNKE